jgi:tRNA-specific 2-thiouridylase
MYVLRLEPGRRAAIVGTREEISATAYELREVRFTHDAPPVARCRTDAVLRYRGTPLAGWVTMRDDRALLELDAPALVAPGQAAVLYDGDEVLGGGIVDRVAPR